jgi:hypothetical protein
MSKSVHDLFDVHANSLLATTYATPVEVLRADISSEQKRCVLAAWASDAFAVEGQPWLRQVPGTADPVPVAQILKALRSLDGNDDGPPRGGGAAQFPVFEELQMAVGF